MTPKGYYLIEVNVYGKHTYLVADYGQGAAKAMAKAIESAAFDHADDQDTGPASVEGARYAEYLRPGQVLS